MSNLNQSYRQGANNLFRKTIRLMVKRLRFYSRDLKNILSYGKYAPKACQTIYIKPTEVTSALASYDFIGRKNSGQVLSGDWDLNTKPLEGFIKYDACVQHFMFGKSWAETGIYEYMNELVIGASGVDDCHSMDDIINRYKKLDALYLLLKRHGKTAYKARADLDPFSFREEGGVYIHIGRNGELIFGGGGFHRFSITRLLGFDSIPAQLGVVHKDFVKQWHEHLLE